MADENPRPKLLTQMVPSATRVGRAAASCAALDHRAIHLHTQEAAVVRGQARPARIGLYYDVTPDEAPHTRVTRFAGGVTPDQARELVRCIGVAIRMLEGEDAGVHPQIVRPGPASWRAMGRLAGNGAPTIAQDASGGSR